MSCSNIHSVLNIYRQQNRKARPEFSRIMYDQSLVLQWSYLEDGLYKSKAEFEFFHDKNSIGEPIA